MMCRGSVHSLPRKALSIASPLLLVHPHAPTYAELSPLSVTLICYVDESPSDCSAGRGGGGRKVREMEGL